MSQPQAIDDFAPDDFAPDDADGFIADDAKVNLPPLQKSRDQLLAEHQKNLMAQPQPQKIIEENGKRRIADISPSPIDLGMEVLKAPLRMAEGIGGLAKTAYDIGTRPADPESAKKLGKLAYGAVEGPVDLGRRALGVYATPKEQAGAIGDIAAGVMLPELPSAAKTLTRGSEFAEGALSRIGNTARSNHMVRGKNQLITALDASEHTASALDNTIGDIHSHMQQTGRQYRDLPSFASVSKDTLDSFVKQNYEPIQQALKDVPEFGALEARGAELNDTLGRLGYYDKNPLMQSFARSSPEVQKVVSEANAVRAQRNALIDQMAPVNIGASNLMRKWADLRQVSDMAGIAAKASEHSKRMISATQPSATAARIAELVSAATAIGMGQPQIALAVRALKMGMNAKKAAPALTPDVLVARASRNLSRGEKAIAQPIPIRATPIKLPGAQPAKAADVSGQIDMPFVEPEVGGIPQEIGTEAQQTLPFHTHGDVARENARQQAHYDRTIQPPSQRALPPKREGPILPSGETIELPERPSRLALPEPRSVDETPVPPVAGPRQPRERTPQSRREELLRNFGGTVRTREKGPSNAPSSTSVAPSSPSSPPLSGPILPVVKGQKLQPYAGPERRVSSLEANQGRRGAEEAARNPEIASRAARLKDAYDAASPSEIRAGLRAKFHDELSALSEQNPWIADYLVQRNVMKGGVRQ